MMFINIWFHIKRCCCGFSRTKKNCLKYCHFKSFIARYNHLKYKAEAYNTIRIHTDLAGYLHVKLWPFCAVIVLGEHLYTIDIFRGTECHVVKFEFTTWQQLSCWKFCIYTHPVNHSCHVVNFVFTPTQ